MANTYSQIYFHVVIVVKYREFVIRESWEERLHKYMYGIAKSKGVIAIQINGMPDHVHLLLCTQPETRLSDVVRDIKANSSKFINENRWVRGKFSWQPGFGAFSISRGHVDRVEKYIQNQKQHHKQESFKQEYLELLRENEVEYKEEYLFDFLDERVS